jgi:hypothetical protein
MGMIYKRGKVCWMIIMGARENFLSKTRVPTSPQ